MIRRALALAFCLGTLAATPAKADISDVLACQAIRNADERLACFDRTVPSLRNAPSPAASAAPAPAGQAPSHGGATPEQRFGAERLTEHGRQGEADSITANVKSIRQIVPGRYLVVLDNDQVWYVKEGTTLRIKPGERVVVERGALDSYLMKKEGAQASYRVERIN